jgi:hypothetical protein
MIQQQHDAQIADEARHGRGIYAGGVVRELITRRACANGTNHGVVRRMSRVLGLFLGNTQNERKLTKQSIILPEVHFLLFLRFFDAFPSDSDPVLSHA